MRVLDTRIDPLRRLDGVWAPQRVGAAGKARGSSPPATRSAGAYSKAVMRVLDTRIDPLQRP